MKRMNLIRVTLFAVFAFMGCISLSAQGTWKTPDQAKEIIVTELNVLNAPPSIPAPVIGMQQADMVQQYAKNTGCPDCFLTKIKKEFLERTLLDLLEGSSDTGASVEEARAGMTSPVSHLPSVVATIEQAYGYMQAKLKN